MACCLHHATEERLPFVSEVVCILNDNDSRDVNIVLTSTLRFMPRGSDIIGRDLRESGIERVK
jgi:hypothetical protein